MAPSHAAPGGRDASVPAEAGADHGDGWPAGVVRPDDLPLVRRRAVRLVVRDRSGRVLLFRAREITIPEIGQWWELPGGGIEAGEDYRRAAVRELREETGIVVPAGAVGPARWRRTATYRYRGTRRLQQEVVAVLSLPGEAPAVDVSAQLPQEVEDYLSWRWMPEKELLATTDRFYPGRLPELLPRLLAGEDIDEPFERFS